MKNNRVSVCISQENLREMKSTSDIYDCIISEWVFLKVSVSDTFKRESLVTFVSS